MRIIFAIILFIFFSLWLTLIVEIGVSAGIKIILKELSQKGGKKDESI